MVYTNTGTPCPTCIHPISLSLVERGIWALYVHFSSFATFATLDTKYLYWCTPFWCVDQLNDSALHAWFATCLTRKMLVQCRTIEAESHSSRNQYCHLFALEKSQYQPLGWSRYNLLKLFAFFPFILSKWKGKVQPKVIPSYKEGLLLFVHISLSCPAHSFNTWNSIHTHRVVLLNIVRLGVDLITFDVVFWLCLTVQCCLIKKNIFSDETRLRYASTKHIAP